MDWNFSLVSRFQSILVGFVSGFSTRITSVGVTMMSTDKSWE